MPIYSNILDNNRTKSGQYRITNPKNQTNVKLQCSNNKCKVKNQGSKIKMTNQNEKMWCEALALCRLAMELSGTTIEGRTTIVFGIWILGFGG